MKTCFSVWRTAAILALVSLPGIASADTIRTFAGYDTNSLPANDDGSTGVVNIGFGANFFGTTYSQLWVNNNGNVTFDAPLSTFTPFSLLSTTTVLIAPFFADVDTRAQGSNLVTYGSGTLGGFNAFASNYLHVGVYNQLSIFNTFQVVLIDRSDTGAGNFDFEFNYNIINWETGQASGSNAQGLGGTSATVGYASGPVNFQLPGSLVNGALLDTNLVTGLIYNQLGTPFDGANMNGRYDFQVRNGQVLPPTANSAVPEPSTYGIIASLGLIALVIARRKKS